MSVSIIILKEIETFSYEKVLLSVQEASERAGLHCIGLNTDWDDTGAFEYLEGTLSEVDAEELRTSFQKGIPVRQCGFSIERPTELSYDSFTWLVHRKNYFWALDLQYLNGDYAFAFRFLAQYFNLRENSRDYVWVDDTDWFYSAEDMIWLSRRPYRPEWSFKKLTAVP